MNLHYYRGILMENIPLYDEYNYSTGAAGYVDKLSEETAKSAGMRYLGYGTYKEVVSGVKTNTRPQKRVKTYYFGSGR